MASVVSAAAAARKTRCPRGVRLALSDNPWAERKPGDKREGQDEGDSPWFMPGMEPLDEVGEDGEILERKKPLEESEYCCWVTPKKKASAFLKAWAEQEEASDEQKDILEGLASAEFDQGWSVWGLCHTSKGREPGFYIMPPGEPEILTVMEAVDEVQVDVQHVAVKPSAIGKNSKQAFLDWVESLRPKMVVVKRPKELYAFDLGVEEGDGKGIKKGSGPKVSKGL